MKEIKFSEPSKQSVTIYKISGCKYCENSIKILKDSKIDCTIINCDKYVSSLQSRDIFYKFIQQFTIDEYRYFPMIFFNGKFIGGYMELSKMKNK